MAVGRVLVNQPRAKRNGKTKRGATCCQGVIDSGTKIGGELGSREQAHIKLFPNGIETLGIRAKIAPEKLLRRICLFGSRA